jgi:hypothetical protein
VSTPPEHPNQSEEELRVVVDAQIVLTMFLARRDRSGLVSPKRELLGLLTEPKFRWLWTDLRLLGESYGNVQTSVGVNSGPSYQDSDLVN